MILLKHQKLICNITRFARTSTWLTHSLGKRPGPKGARIGAFGKNGEPRAVGIALEGQRASSTCLPERDLVTGKRSDRRAEGKEPKSMDCRSAPKRIHQQDVAYRNSSSLSFPSSDELGSKTSTWIERLATLQKLKPSAKAERLWSLVKDINLWVAAYKKLAPNPGSMTKGGAGGTIDGTSMRSIKALRDSVVECQFRFGTTRRVYIPKAGVPTPHFVPPLFGGDFVPQGGKRPLGIPQFQDRLVQEVVRTILEAIYEPKFLPNSHGFRPGRSQHTCLKQIRKDFRGTIWYIEGDISKCFDTINHDQLLKTLSRTIQDHKFLELIRSGLQTKTLMPEKQIEKTLIGMPQGGVCSPLLSNIVLHEMDMFLTKLKRIIDRGSERRMGKEYGALTSLRSRAKRSGSTQIYKKSLKEARRFGYGDPLDANFRRLNFVRYADDFLIGIVGPLKLATRVKELVSKFLSNKLKLRLSTEKTLITRAKGNNIPFLGYYINHGPPNMYTYRRRYQGKWRIVRVRRAGHIRLLVQMKKVIKRLALKGFCDQLGEPRPNFHYFQDPQSYTTSQVGSILRGISNYYHLAETKRKCVSRISYILSHSLAKTFAAKFKLGTRRKVFALAGRDLSRPLKAKSGKTAVGMTDSKLTSWAQEAGGNLTGALKGVPYRRVADISLSDLKPLSSKWVANKKDASFKDPLERLRWRGLRGRTSLTATCAICESADGVEMHHVRALKDLKGRDLVEQLMIAARRKQIPLLRSTIKPMVEGRKRVEQISHN